MPHEIETLERRGWEALSGTDGDAFYRDLMADDGLMVFPRLVLDKEQTITAIAAERPWSSFELTDVRVVEAGSDCAVISYRASARRGPGPYDALMSTVYVRRDGRWQLVLHQQTPDPAGS
ncbi:MAG: nuclear transport factor 2 family protein [Candidatus Limnocylindria bacterium]